ncbi:MAG: hypothetical protein KAR84_06770 [Elusimicrobiales bacterium]|nr:hypothetical protein [Elusimicrobiales bacterium]MCK5583360.1 hypothetical protein [Elusimicrobiales bacterium]
MKAGLFYNLIFVTILICLSFLVYFLMSEEKNIPVVEKPVLNKVVSFESSDKMKIRQYLNIFQRQKNKIEKSLEKKIYRIRFSLADCDEIQRTAFACEKLFLKMGKDAYSSVNLARIKAANTMARQLALDSTKLKSFVGAKKKNRRKIYRQLLKVEGEILKIDIHLNALLEN